MGVGIRSGRAGSRRHRGASARKPVTRRAAARLSCREPVTPGWSAGRARLVRVSTATVGMPASAARTASPTSELTSAPSPRTGGALRRSWCAAGDIGEGSACSGRQSARPTRGPVEEPILQDEVGLLGVGRRPQGAGAAVREAVVGHQQVPREVGDVQRDGGVEHADAAGEEQGPHAERVQREGLGAPGDLVRQPAVGPAVPEAEHPAGLDVAPEGHVPEAGRDLDADEGAEGLARRLQGEGAPKDRGGWPGPGHGLMRKPPISLLKIQATTSPISKTSAE